jgi:hypothetical protein
VDQGRRKKVLTSFGGGGAAGQRYFLVPDSGVWASDCRENKSDVSNSVSLILGEGILRGGRDIEPSKRVVD